jgi:hypothetical protein
MGQADGKIAIVTGGASGGDAACAVALRVKAPKSKNLAAQRRPHRHPTTTQPQGEADLL